MIRAVKDLVAEANGVVDSVTPAEAQQLIGNDSVVFVDLRDPRELERDGKIPGAFHCPRGMLEFWIDPASPYHKPVFASGKRLLFYCASGWRSALSTRTAKDMGLSNICHLAGGLTAWRAAGGEIEVVIPKSRQ